MDINNAMDGLPMEVREFLKTSLSEHQLSEKDPVCTWVLLVAHFLEGSAQRRSRRRWLGVCLFFTLITCVLTGIGMMYYGRWQVFEEMKRGHAVINIKSGKEPMKVEAFEYNGEFYLRALN